MKNIYIVARNTLVGIIRNRTFYGIGFLAILILLSTYFLGSLSLGNDLKVVRDLGQAGIYLFTLIITIFFGATSLHQEISTKTFLTVISHPISKLQFLLGKFFGIITSSFFSVLIMQTFYVLVVFLIGHTFDSASLWQLPLLLFEIALITSLALLFSSFTSEISAIIYTTCFVFIGHSLSIILKAVQKANAIGKMLGTAIYYLFPNLEKFDIRNTIVYNIVPSPAQIIYPLLYCALFVFILLFLTKLALDAQED